MRNSVFNLLAVIVGFAISVFAVPTLRSLEEARERALDIDPQRGELLFFTADW